MTRIFKISAISMIFIFLTACDFLMGTTTQKLSTPVDLVIFDDELTWSEVTGADGYVIYVDDEQLEETDVTSFIFTGERTYDQTITVKAFRTTEEGKDYSSLSEEVILYSNAFSTVEVMAFDFSEQDANINQSYSISSQIRKVYIKGNSSTVYTNVSFLVENRSKPLEIQIENFNAIAPVNSSLIYSSGTLGEGPLITINSKGTSNSLKGGNNTVPGANGANGSTFGATGADGSVGNPGYSAIHLSNVLVKGTANLTLTGGNGSNGGNGGNGHFFAIYTNFGGDGGNGGAGGYGAEFTKLYVKLENRSLTMIGGLGGNGGAAGNSVLTNSPSNGQKGKDQSGHKGQIEVISGVVS